VITLESNPSITPLQVWRDPVTGVPLWHASDAVLALPLFTTWAVRTGRALRPVPVSDLTAKELIDFWADDQLEPKPGRGCEQLLPRPPFQPNAKPA
jgi:hypothetical protein